MRFGEIILLARAMVLLGLVSGLTGACQQNTRPRVFVFTDINIDAGDPDDRQSLIHLLWYADELKIEGIVPDRWNAGSVEACQLAIEAYAEDYMNFNFDKKGYPAPENIANKIAHNFEESFELFETAVADSDRPLYVLVWGNMEVISKILLSKPNYSKNIRLITIGTGLMLEEDIKDIPPNWEKSKPCQQPNWNGAGRNLIYNHPDFNNIWWLEINWTYAGMFSGNEPGIMFKALSKYGSLGAHMEYVVKNEPWAQYFRVGDTPSVLYLLDRNHDSADPTKSSWAGKFIKPFPREKPNYYTDDNGMINWDYSNPCATWENHKPVSEKAKSTLTEQRPKMYKALIEKLDSIYNFNYR